MKFNISEIFYSIQGEGTRAGQPCVFVRLQGCNLRCSWCDTAYAQNADEELSSMTHRDIIKEVSQYKCNFIEFTGGEPLSQEGVNELMAYFADIDYTVALETNGSISIENVDRRIIRIMDIKTPSSAMTEKNLYANIKYLNPKDEVKFVIADEQDYEFAKNCINLYNIHNKTKNILLSPVFGIMEPQKLAELILKDNLPARLQLQIHKYIWDKDRRGV